MKKESMENSRKKSEKNNMGQIDNFKYLDLLNDNSPKSFPEYNAEARILKTQIEKPGIYNIAVVGKYGAGKSSVINTYLNKYRQTKWRQKKHTRITLSTFNGTEYDEIAIERSILQQLLYSRNKNELPNSEVKRTNKTSSVVSFIKTLLIMGFIVSTALFALVLSGHLAFGYNKEWIKILLFIISTFFLSILIFWSIHFRKFKRIKYKDFEVELRDSKKSPSLINKFVDEVLYFFDCTNNDLVIFEDLDRLQNTDIFVKLRELNTIINNSKRRGGKVTFLYAVKDELFKTEEERGKFFEFILQVVPVINPITTSEELRKELKKFVTVNKQLELPEKFIKGVSQYITNKRILNNTFNDYIIMYSKIFEDTDSKYGHLNNITLFALSLYKNLFPYDYALLENNEGLIPLAIDIKELRKKCNVFIQSKIEDEEKKLTDLQNEKLSSIKELKYEFVGQFLYKRAKSRTYSDTRPAINVYDENFSFINCDYSHIMHPKHDSPNSFIEFSDKSELISPNGRSYAEREKVISELCTNAEQKTRNLIAMYKKEQQSVFNYSFSEAISILSVDASFSDDLAERYEKKYKFSQQVDLQIGYLRFLVANRYIDDKFIEYTSNYKAQLITPRDVQFVIDIQSRIPDFYYVPDNIQSVIRRLDVDDFNNISIMNKEILDNIMTIMKLDENEQTKKYDTLINFLVQSEGRVFDEIIRYITVGTPTSIEKLIRAIMIRRPNICADLISSGKLGTAENNLLAIIDINYGVSQNIEAKDIVSVYLARNDNYSNIFYQCKKEKLIEFLKTTRPLFKKINFEEVDPDIQQCIISDNLYEITVENLETIFGLANNQKSNQNFYSQQYSFILSSEKQSVIDYIKSNINDYVLNVLLDDRVTLKKEKQKHIEEILKNKAVSIDTRNALIKKCKVNVQDISDFDFELYNSLLDEDKIKPTWENIIVAYSKIGYDSSIKNYVIDHTLEGNFKLNNFDDGENTALLLFTDLLKTDLHYKGSNNSIFSSIKTGYSLNKLNIKAMIDETSSEEINIIDNNLTEAITHGLISYAKDDMDQLFILKSSLVAYIKKYEKEILTEIDIFFSYMYSEEILNNDTDIRAVNLLVGEIISDKEISTSIKKNLIEKCCQVLQIKTLEKEYANFFITESLPVPSKILWQFASVATLSAEEKQTLLFLSCDSINLNAEKEEYIEYFSSIDKDWEKVYKVKNEKLIIEPTEIANKLLRKLKGKGMLKYRKEAKYNNKVVVRNLTK